MIGWAALLIVVKALRERRDIHPMQGGAIVRVSGGDAEQSEIFAAWLHDGIGDAVHGGAASRPSIGASASTWIDGQTVVLLRMSVGDTDRREIWPDLGRQVAANMRRIAEL
jgi:hypothetical protein